jgi:hypothetical protein
MIVSREDLYLALFGMVNALLAPGATSAAPGVVAAPGLPTPSQPFNMVSREVIEVQRVAPLLQPVLFMDEAIEEYVRSGQGLVHNKWTVYFHVGCTSTKGTPASAILNPLIDTLELALDPKNGDNLLGLGDLVQHAQFSGMAIKNLGNNSLAADQRQAVAYIPFEIMF